MARGHKLTDSISISELMHMREVEGLSNGEIARKLGCSINTIHAHIGTHPEGKRAKRKDKCKQLTSLPEKQIPDLPRESFKERCDRLMARADERKADAEADKAREAHCKALDMAAQLSNDIVPVIVHGTVYDIPKVAYEMIKNEVLKNAAPAPVSYADSRAHVNELLAVFGPDVVRDYLRVALYALGIPDSRQVRREHLLDALNTLNKEATCND